jgi:hypothetical protein
MIYWGIGKVEAIIYTAAGIQEIVLRMKDGRAAKAIHYTVDFPPLTVGDSVKVNTTAVELGLGTGGYHFVYSLLDNVAETDDGCAEKAGDAGIAKHAGGSEEAAVNVTGAAIAGRLADDEGVDGGNQTGGTVRVGHLMKLRYTPGQRAVLSAEEPASPHHDLFRRQLTLEGMPVLIGDVHSMLPAAVAWLRHVESDDAADLLAGGAGNAGEPEHAAGDGKRECGLDARGSESRDIAGEKQPAPAGGSPRSSDRPQLRIAYVMSDGGALPLAFSRHAAGLKERGWLQGTVTYGHAYGGDLETVNKFTALLAARHVYGADLAVAVMGPGIAGTGTPLGHSGLEAGELVNAVAALDGTPIVMPRLSFADRRERHRGLSHHTLGSLAVAALAPALLPLPAALAEEQRRLLERQLLEHGLIERHHVRWMAAPSMAAVLDCISSSFSVPLTTMGRNVQQDPYFFWGVSAAAQAAWEHVRCRPSD